MSLWTYCIFKGLPTCLAQSQVLCSTHDDCGEHQYCGNTIFYDFYKIGKMKYLSFVFSALRESSIGL